MLDIFKQDAFSVISLTDALNDVKHVPGFLGSMGLFTPTPITTTTVAIEKKGASLVLVPPSARGGPGTAAPDKQKRNLRPFMVPHFELADAVYAEEVQGVRAMGQEQAVETVQGQLAQRFAEHQNSFSATEEYHRIGAVKGIVTYADGSTLDLFDEFDVTQEAEVDFDLDNANPGAGALRKKAASVIRLIASKLEGLPFSGVMSLASDSFYDLLIAHTEVRATYLQTEQARELRSGYVNTGGSNDTFGTFEFGGITWVNYRGAVGNTKFVADDKAVFFPLGVPGLFRSYYAPADYLETVNTLGKRLYAKQYEMQNGKGIHLDVQHNALQICTRPQTLIKAKMT